jgi:hypothetical protein
MARTAALIPATLYTLSDLERRSGVKRRILQIWGDSGVLLPEGATAHGGKGIPRRFPASEAIVAVLVKPLAAANIQIGHLAGLAKVVRDLLGLPPSGRVRGTLGLTQAAQTLVSTGTVPVVGTLSATQAANTLAATGVTKIEHALSRALRGEGENFLLVTRVSTRFIVGALVENDPPNPPSSGIASENDPASHPPSGIADFFRLTALRGEPPDMAFCLNLKRLAGIFNEDPPG